YYAGKNPGSPSGTYTCYGPASPSYFLGKISPEGGLLWQTNFGVTTCVQAIALSDLGLDEIGNVYVGYWFRVGSYTYTSAWKMSPDGSALWNVGVFSPLGFIVGPVLLGPLWSTNGTVSGFNGTHGEVSRLNLNDGTSQALSSGVYVVPRGCVGNQFHQ